MKTMNPQPAYMMRYSLQNTKFYEMQVPQSIHENVPEHYEVAYTVDLGYEEDAPMVVAVKYIPVFKSEKHGFVVIYLMEGELGNEDNLIPCMMMRDIWFRSAMEPRNFMRTYILDSTGKVVGKDGHMPTDDEISDCACHMLGFYAKWYRFPFESDWGTVCDLCQAQDNVTNLNREIRSHRIKDSLEKARKTIADLQCRISVMEEELNGLYEDAADGLNVLEEHGYKMEIEKEEPPMEVPNAEDLF